jgi:hypothetical protein
MRGFTCRPYKTFSYFTEKYPGIINFYILANWEGMN